MNSEGCIVRGTLALVLKICRIFGIAPLRLEKFQDGYRATVSYYYAIYSFILVTFIIACPIVGLCVDIQNRAIKAVNLLSLAFEVPDTVAAAICSGFGGYYGIRRMNKMIKYLNRLDKAKMGINNKTNNNKMKNRDNLNFVIIVFYTAIFLICTLAEVYFLIITFTAEKYLITTYSLSSIVFYNMILMELQIILVLQETYTVLKSINNKLDEILSVDIVENECIKIVKCKNICSLSHAYVTVCDIILAINETEGGIILVIFTNFVTTFITNFYHELILFTELPNLYLFFQGSWCGLYVFRVMVFIETCHTISSEVTKMNVILNLLMQKTTNIGKRIPCEIELMYKQLLLNKPKFSPLEVFTPERSTIITMLSAVITYILFMIQLKL